jgi:hypothetical protein
VEEWDKDVHRKDEFEAALVRSPCSQTAIVAPYHACFLPVYMALVVSLLLMLSLLSRFLSHPPSRALSFSLSLPLLPST